MVNVHPTISACSAHRELRRSVLTAATLQDCGEGAFDHSAQLTHCFYLLFKFNMAAFIASDRSSGIPTLIKIMYIKLALVILCSGK